ncbi:ATP-grasp domain-containing protein [Lunatimonas lonarensis]|nr:hypothetical protein [Lunatimonas lonarensis]
MKLSISPNVHLVEPGDFEPTDHWYPRVLNSNIHPLVSYFLNLSNEQIAERYCRLNPGANFSAVERLLAYQPTYFRWSGTDLMHVTNHEGNRKLTVIETNSCPSGQKSMPLLDMNAEKGGYKRLIESTFKPMVDGHDESGVLAVIYDKNPMENVGYAATIADVFGENVYLAKFVTGDGDPPVRFDGGKMSVRSEKEDWIEVRAAFRYVTQMPWDRLPLASKTLLLNPLEACLAGGRNKTMASRAYEEFNAANSDNGIGIFTPQTFREVEINQLNGYLSQLGGSMVIKVPDSNAGQGVYTIVNQQELDKAMEILAKNPDDRYIVQQLIASNHIEGTDPSKNWYHVGTIPDSKGRSYVFDIRMMMHATDEGMRPLAAYSRKANLPLNRPIPEGMDSWDVYGTNLSIKGEDGWTYADERLMLFDIRNFGLLGLGMDELIQGFLQSVMAVYAIDQQAIRMYNPKKSD